MNIGNSFWIMTPAGGYNSFDLNGWGIFGLGVGTSGYLDDGVLIDACGVCPVINIKSTVTISGTGTMNAPYLIA